MIFQFHQGKGKTAFECVNDEEKRIVFFFKIKKRKRKKKKVGFVVSSMFYRLRENKGWWLSIIGNLL